MWWIPAGKVPTLQEAVDNLAYLEENGATEAVFYFRRKYARPD